MDYLIRAWARAAAEKKPKVSSPSDAVPYFSKWINKKQEHLIVLCLNGAHFVTRTVCVSIGIMNRTLIHPREVFRTAILTNSAAIVIAHNHPSGNLEPSPEDDTVCNKLKNAGEIIGIPLLDFLIFAKTGYYSYMERGKL